MRKIYEKYFYVPEKGKGKVNEKVFFARLAFSVLFIVFCMCAMGYNAYAYFSAGIGSAKNTLQATTYTLEITPSVAGGTGDVTIDTTAEHRYTLQPGRYDFKLVKPETATASTGYCRVDIGEEENKTSFYTQQVGKVADSETPINERIITISVDKVTVVHFVPCWGTYAGVETHPETYLADGKAIQVKINEMAVVDATVFQSTEPAPVSEDSGETAVKTQQEETTSKQEETAKQQEETTKQEETATQQEGTIPQ